MDRKIERCSSLATLSPCKHVMHNDARWSTKWSCGGDPDISDSVGERLICQRKKWTPLKSESSTCNQLRFCNLHCRCIGYNLSGKHGLNSSYLEFPYQKKHWTYRIQGMFVYQTRAGRKPCQTDLTEIFGSPKQSIQDTLQTKNLRLEWKRNSDFRCWHADFQAFQVGSYSNPGPILRWTFHLHLQRLTQSSLHAEIPPPKTNMTMENPPFEDVFPIENGDFPMSC